ncbi:glycosyltransferase [Cupriavidus sp. DB3]|uniref:glycosyltransferase n=1 Tax=Cupriavidus sp. DB3 TaxID=2873259 RepID=UPI001CF5F3BA|nr:glycosyltransferase [Cupriavidus sp. DB3]MCA7085494.1 glycosyltransferase [Cupriavidus sp. DB3]
MRVLHVYRTYFPDPPGGLQEAIRQTAQSCGAYGIESRIFTLSPDPTPAVLQFPEGMVVRSRSWAAPASCDLGGPAALLRYRRLARWADVLHFHFPWPFGDVLRLLGCVSRPAVMTYHSDIVRQRWLGKVYGPLMHRMLKSMSAVVATSPAYARTSPVLGQLLPPEKLRVIPLGIADYASNPGEGTDARTLARLGLSGRPFVLALGVLRYYKGLHTLIDAASSIGADIVIAGSGPEAERLRAQAAARGVANVHFAGQVSEEEKRVLLRSCTIMVLPSQLRSEAFGMVLVEAAMFSKPMVCCEIGSGTSYVNQHGVTGWVVPPETPAALAEAVNRLVGDPETAARMGQAARLRYEQLFSSTALGQAYSALYREVVGR